MVKKAPIWTVLWMMLVTVGIVQAQAGQQLPPIPPEAVGWVEGMAYAVAVQDNYAYIGFGNVFTVVDVTDKSIPIVVATLPLATTIEEVHLAQNAAFLLLDNLGFWVIDITNSLSPFVISFYLEENLIQMVIQDQYAYGIADTYLKIWDISDLQNIQLSSSTQPDYSDLAWISELVVKGERVYLMKSEMPELTWVFDVSNPIYPIQISSWVAGALNMALVGRSLFYYEEICLHVCYAGLSGWNVSNVHMPLPLGTDTQVLVYSSLYSYMMKGEGIYLYVGTDAAVFAYLPAQPAENGQVVMAYPLAHVRDLAVSQGYLWVASEQGLIIFEDLPRQKAFLPVHLR